MKISKFYKILKIVFISLFFSIFIGFFALITSKELTNKIFEYVQKELPIKYSKIDGNLYSGIKIYDLNYDDMVKAKSLYINPSILSLLLKEIYIYDLKLESISFEDSFFALLKQEEKENKKEEQGAFSVPFTLFIKNFDASLYDFVYENQKIDELVLTSKNISSNLKDFVSANIFANLKSDIANLEAKMEIVNNIYKLNSKIDLKKYLKTKLELEANGDLEKVNFILKNSDLKLEDDKNLNLKNTVILGNFDINTHFLDIKNLDSNLNYKDINSNIKAKASIENFDIEKLNFNINLQTTIKKSILEGLEKDLELKSNLTGDIKEIKIDSFMDKNSLNIDKNSIKIENSTINAIAKLKEKDLFLNADFNLKTNLADKKSKIDLKLNLDRPEEFILSVKSVLENLRYENYNLKPLGSLNLQTRYKNGLLNLDLDSKLANLSLKSLDFKRFDFLADLKNINPNEFYKFDEFINISKVDANIKGFYDEDINFDTNLTLNSSFNLKSKFISNKNSFNFDIKNSSFDINVNKSEDINIDGKILNLSKFTNELSKIIGLNQLDIEGEVDFNADILKNGDIEFALKSDKISYEKEQIKGIETNFEMKNNILNISKLNFFIDNIYDIELNRKFTLNKPAFFNIDSFDGSFDFGNILLKTSKENENIILTVNSNKLAIKHNIYADALLDLNLKINIDKESKIGVQGEVRADKLEVIYAIPALSISKDKDIIILSKDKKIIEKDYFLQNISLELLVFADNIKYKLKNIDLKAKALLNIKKEFEKDIGIYGSIHDVKGTFTELGKEYKIENSNIYFRGNKPINPLLDIKANTKVEDIDIFIIITGALNNPRINLNSNPTMNQKDILSYLIFGTSFSNTTNSNQNRQSQASLFLLNELSKDYAKELGIDSVYFKFDSATQFIETHIGKNIGEKNKIILKNRAFGGELVFLRELTKLWNLEIGVQEKTQSIDFIYKKRY